MACRTCGGSGRVQVDTADQRPWFGVVFMASPGTDLKVGDFVMVHARGSQIGRHYEQIDNMPMFLNCQGDDVQFWAGADWTSVGEWDKVVFCHQSFATLWLGDAGTCSDVPPESEWEEDNFWDYEPLGVAGRVCPVGASVVTEVGEKRKVREEGIYLAGASVHRNKAWAPSHMPRVRLVVSRGPVAGSIPVGSTVFLKESAPDYEALDYEIHCLDRIYGIVSEYHAKEN